MLLQLTINTVVATATTVLVASGFAISYQAFPYFYFAYAALLPTCPYVTLWFQRVTDVPFWLAAIPGLLVTALLAGSFDVLVHRNLRAKNASRLVHLVASLGLFTLGTAFLTWAFGAETRSLRSLVSVNIFTFGGIRITSVQVLTIAMAVLAVIVIWILLRHTSWGNELRAIAADRRLASVIGIKVEAHTTVAFVLGGLFCGIAGLLLAVENDVRPQMGLTSLLTASIVVLVGGASHLKVLVIAAILLAIVQSAGAWYLGTIWKDAVAFSLLCLVMLFNGQSVKA